MSATPPEQATPASLLHPCLTDQCVNAVCNTYPREGCPMQCTAAAVALCFPLSLPSCTLVQRQQTRWLP
jgi:hypothetical protein